MTSVLSFSLGVSQCHFLMYNSRIPPQGQLLLPPNRDVKLSGANLMRRLWITAATQVGADMV